MSDRRMEMLNTASGIRWLHCQLRGMTVTLGCLLLLGCNPGASGEPVTVHTLSVRTLYPEALQIATTWKPDAYLIGASAYFAIDYPDCSPPSVRFSFYAPSAPYFFLRVQYNSEAQAFEEEAVSSGGSIDSVRYPQILDTDWAVDSTEALEIAQANGGAEFLAGRSSHYLCGSSVELEKKMIEGQWVTRWCAGYFDVTTPKSLFVHIDALSGEVTYVGPGISN